MLHAVISRSALHEFLARSNLLRTFEPAAVSIERGPVLMRSLHALGRTQCIAIWQGENPGAAASLPAILVVNDGEEREWLAWFVNYMAHIRPFTAHCRILPASIFEAHYAREQYSGRDGIETLGGAFVGLVLGEMLSSEQFVSRAGVEPIAALTCSAALSFALARASHLGLNLIARDEIAERWRHLRGYGPPRDLDPHVLSGVVSIAETLQRLLDPDPGDHSDALLRSLFEMLGRGSLSSSTGARVHPLLSTVGEDATVTREARLERLRTALTRLVDRPSEPHTSFAIAYLANRISPGSLLHVHLLTPLARAFPEVLLWYGVCAGLSDRETLFGAFEGLGRRLFRDLIAPSGILQRPTADIGLDELILLGPPTQASRATKFTTASSSRLIVELAPGVSSVISWSRSRARNQASHAIDRGEARNLLRELDDLSAHVAFVRERASTMLRSEIGPDLPAPNAPDRLEAGEQARLPIGPSPSSRSTKRRTKRG